MGDFTEADYKSWRFLKDAMHINGGKEFFGYGHRCIDQPRLLVIDKYFKRDRSTQRSYIIDGKTPCPSLDEALAALSNPPELEANDLARLRSVPDDWHRPEDRFPLVALADVGFVEWGRDADKKVTCRRTDAGRSYLEQQGT